MAVVLLEKTKELVVVCRDERDDGLDEDVVGRGHQVTALGALVKFDCYPIQGYSSYIYNMISPAPYNIFRHKPAQLNRSSRRIKMSSAIEIKKIFIQKSERVKSIDLHPSEPWVLLGLYSGNVSIWNSHTQAIEKTFETGTSPVRTAKFVAHKDWIVVGSDDGFLRVYNYNNVESVVEFKAHTDYIRSVAVHPSLPYILSASDDKLIKLWDWENGWACTKTFEGHGHYIMQVVFSPRDANVFASVSLDCTIKMWNLGSSSPQLSIEGHSKGLNFVAFFEIDEKLYFITGSDDYTSKVWDYESGTCVQTLEGHTNNVTSILCVNSNINCIITGSEDKTVHVWDASTYKLDHVFTSELGRVWTIGFIKDSSQIILGCDEGILVGQAIPACS